MDGPMISEDAKVLATLKELIVEHVPGVESLDQLSDESRKVAEGLIGK